MQEALTALLLGDAGISALVADRVHWMRLPATVAGRPYLTLQTIRDPTYYHFEGETNWYDTIVQADAWAENYASAHAVSQAFKAALSGYAGVLDGIRFRSIKIDQTRDLPGADQTGKTLFRKSIDFTVTWAKEN